MGNVYSPAGAIRVRDLISVGLLAGLSAASSWGEERAPEPAASGELAEVIVTAQKREQDIQSVGISMTAITGQQLQQLGLNNTNQLGNQVPGLIVADFGSPDDTVFALRGVSQIDFADHEESPVAVFVDGAYIPYLAGVGMSLFDLDRAEVLRGPQSTLFGRNATGGLVQLISAKPTTTPEGYATLTVGQYGLTDISGAISGPISDNVQGRLAVSSIKHDGLDRNNAGPNKYDQDVQNFRAQLRVEPGDGVDFTLMLRGTRDRDASTPYVPVPGALNPSTGLAYVAGAAAHGAFCQSFFGVSGMAGSVGCYYYQPYTGNKFQISQNQDGVGFRRYDTGATGTLNWELGWAKLIAVTNYEQLAKEYGPEDDDGTPQNAFTFGQTTHAWDASQEVRLEGSNARDRWVTGVYMLRIDGKYYATSTDYGFDPTITAATDNYYTLRTDTWAVFGQNEFDFTPALTLTTGIRWTQDDKHFALYPNCTGPSCVTFGYTNPDLVQSSGYYDGVPGARTNRNRGNWAGKLQLDWHVTDSTLVYTGVTRGTKAGGYNGQPVATWTVPQTMFNDEVLTDYEAGFKSTFADNRVRLNGSAYFYDYHSLQVFSQQGLLLFTFNTDAKVYGAELELKAAPVKGIELGIDGAWLRTLTNPIQNLDAFTGTTRFARQELPFSPHFSSDVYIRKDWVFDRGKFSLQADAKWTDTHKVELLDDPGLVVPPTAVANARATYQTQDKRWSLAVFCNNVFNKVYIANGTNYTAYDGTFLMVYSPPRWYGGTLSYRW